MYTDKIVNDVGVSIIEGKQYVTITRETFLGFTQLVSTKW